MGNESWLSSLWWSSAKSPAEPEKLVIGVLAYEVSNFMSKVVHLWQCLGDNNVVRLREEVMSSEGVRKLVSEDEDFILGLVCGEIIQNLEILGKFVGRLGKRCKDPGLQQFECVFDDFVQNNVDLYGWEYRWKKMERKVKKMGRFVAVNASLNQELEVLTELERSLRRMQGGSDKRRIGLLEFQQKVVWQRQEVKNLRQSSLCNRTYDYTVRLLARSLFTIFGRIKHVFGTHQMEDVLDVDDISAISADYLPRSHSISTLTQSSIHPSGNNLAKFSAEPRLSFKKSGSISSTNIIGVSNTRRGLVYGINKTRNGQCQTQNQSTTLLPMQPHRKVKRLSSVGPFKGCMTSETDSPVIHSFIPVSTAHLRSNFINSGVTTGPKDVTVDSFNCGKTLPCNLPVFGSKQVLSAPPFTLGAAALALHYANIIIVIEKLVASPELIGPDARDDLYNMLPTSIRVSLRARLKPYIKNLTSFGYNTELATKWSEALTRILEWLAPLAHNMIRWQSERSLEQQYLVSRTNMCLVLTLYFANQAKTEAAIIELLVGLNYMWRIGRALEVQALPECAVNRSFDASMYPKG